MTDHFKYEGDELALFQHAINWKKYFSRQIQPFIKGAVLEVGAGIGSTTLLLNDGKAAQWLLLEPDPAMSSVLKNKMGTGELPGNCRLQTGTIDKVTTTFDTIIYIDVLEHIENDTEELKKATALLNKNGHIIVLSPAFQFLYNPFDKVIGHYRRYNKSMFNGITAAGLELIHCRYYDSVGYFAALMNKWLLRKKYPSLQQVLFWDRWMVPLSTLTDRLVFNSFGKSIIATWKKQR
ncbi:MAG: class I SAM-dependent methyltransferase [Bacteroidota bacterium]|nr:class I SAM-dependent methyltransferase [Bacteroidota bacterium]